MPEPEREKDFITELRPDVDDKVDRVLERLERGQHENIEADLQALLKAYPDYHLTNFAMGVCRVKIEDDPVGAIPFFEKAIEIFPYFSEAHYNLGNCERMGSSHLTLRGQGGTSPSSRRYPPSRAFPSLLLLGLHAAGARLSGWTRRKISASLRSRAISRS
jgi:tetratricopeptide (TPR) repeat protein